MLGRWRPFWQAQPITPYPEDGGSYAVGAAWLAECLESGDVVEDWGCGPGLFLRALVLDAPENRPRLVYRGVDATATDTLMVVRDLREYVSDVPAIFMRHVLEHNHDWPRVLGNLLRSFRQRAFVALHVSMSDVGTQLVSWDTLADVPVLALDRYLLLDLVAQQDVALLVEHLNGETLLFLERTMPEPVPRMEANEKLIGSSRAIAI